MDLSPVLVFCYKRLDSLQKTIDSLKSNHLSEETELFIFSDGNKNDLDKSSVEEVRKFIRHIKGFKRIIITENKVNIGLANNIISGVTKIISERDSVIVLEDDLIISENFLQYMNQALSFYRGDDRVFSISGYTPNLKKKEYSFDTYFTNRSSSWGWATWKKEWMGVDWSMEAFDRLTLTQRFGLRIMGSDFSSLLKKQKKGKIDSWAVRFCFHQYLNKSISVFPVISKIQNIGFGDDLATHTGMKDDRFYTVLDISGKDLFKFRSMDLGINVIMNSQFLYYYGLRARLLSKIKNLFL